MTVLLGLLANHVALLRREREKSLELIAAEAKLAENYAKLQEAHDRLQQADRRKNEFLAMLSHELRNPLATVCNALQVMKVHGAAEPALARVQDAAIRQSGHMARLLDDLLDVARITRGNVTLKREPTDLAAVVEAAIEAVEPQIETRSHRLNLSPLPPLRVEGDAGRLTQAVSNLLHNAAKYTPNGGEIHVDLEQDNHHSVIRVRDNGIGIAPATLSGIFDLFVQADHSLDRTSAGLGIGLTVTRTLIEMHGGTVEVHSDGIGKGSEFVLRLPLVAQYESAAQGQRQ